MVRCGIAVYGMDPFGVDPAAAWTGAGARAELVCGRGEAVARGESAGYGRRFVAERERGSRCSRSATATAGGAGCSNNAEVLIGGRRRPLVGTVSMDNLTVDLGPDRGRASCCGEEAILIGAQGAERITAEEVARRLGTINYEVTCALTPRVPRSYHRDGDERDD